MTAHPIRIGLVAFDGCLGSSVAGPLDIFRIANLLLARRRSHKQARFDLAVVTSSGRNVQASNGLVLGSKTLTRFDPDHLIVAGIDHTGAQDLLAIVAASDATRRAIKNFRARKPRACIALPCTATFLCAENGLLGGKKTTTSWWLSALFRKRYPDIELMENELVAEDHHYLSSGGVASYFDLSLKLIDKLVDQDLARSVASVMAIEPARRSQAPFIAEAMAEARRSDFGKRATQWMSDHLHKRVDFNHLARHCAMSKRSLERHFMAEFELSPRDYLVKLRMARGRMLLETTQLVIDEIAEKCGYSDTSAFRKRFAAKVGLGPAAYRDRFNLRPRGGEANRS